jgi:alkanesulfonate monooxygenase SsuD/methylene tetrahydromethanopterin reductase-like flavin-dependent oxidoreductase (luciferase family)
MYIMRFDLRLAEGETPAPEMYEAALDMAEWADRRSCLAVVFSEHHGSPDGYLPAPLLMAAAAATRTRRVLIQVAALIATLRNPVQTAEELAVLDIMSAGRVSAVLGMGYRHAEFDLYGVPMRDRAARMEAAIGVFRRAWAGEPVSDGASRDIRVMPLPLTPGGPPLFLGGGTPAAVRRAARLGLGMLTERGGDLEELYIAECRALGKEPGFFVSGGDATVAAAFVDRDPDAAWGRLGPYLLRDARTYADWHVDAVKPLPGSVVDVATVEDVRRAGRYRIFTPAEAVDHIRSNGPLALHPLCGGAPPELGWSTLRTVEEDVIPNLG